MTRNQTYKTLQEWDATRAYPQDPEKQAQELIAAARDLLAFERCTLIQKNHEQTTYSIQTLYESRPGYPKVSQLMLSPAKDIIHTLVPEQQTRLVTDPTAIQEIFCNDCDPHLGDGSLGAVLLIPLLSEQYLSRLLIFGFTNPEDIPPEKVRFAEMAAERLCLRLENRIRDFDVG